MLREGSIAVASSSGAESLLQLDPITVELTTESGEMVALGAVFERWRRWNNGPRDGGGAKYSARVRSCSDAAGEICGVE